MDVYLDGQRYRLDPADAIGKGGEADIFALGADRALKVFKQPTHPDLAGDQTAQQVAKTRLAEHQKKLKVFPSQLPCRVITPEKLVTNKRGDTVLGYTMKRLTGVVELLRYGDRRFREAGVDDDAAIVVLSDLHRTITEVHKNQVVIGDFNDLNVLVNGREAYLIDSDSFQFSGFRCQQYTLGFVDPVICDPKMNKPFPRSSHTDDTDWFAYTVMVMRTLLFVGPYGGVYRPANGPSIPQDARSLKRITVFDPEVKYPKPARVPEVLPDELLEHFYQVFKKDRRGSFPLDLLQDLEWKICDDCGGSYARHICPYCGQLAPRMVTSIHTGTVSAERLFETTGRIVYVTGETGVLQWVYHKDNTYRRENGAPLLSGDRTPGTRIRVTHDQTVVANGNIAWYVAGNETERKITVDTFASASMIEVDKGHIYWLSGGSLYRSGKLGIEYPERLGELIRNQTAIWAGSGLGFGFYRAGYLSQCFLFNTVERSIKDSLSLNPFEGQLIDAVCRFGDKRVWFLLTQRIAGATINRCYLIRPNGTVEAEAETLAGDGSWLGTIHGHCAAGDFLLTATDDGIERIKARGRVLAVDKKFPDTARFVDSGKHLSIVHDGLAAAGPREIWKLSLA